MSLDFFDSENRPVASSQEDLALLGSLRLLGVDGDVEELSADVSLPRKGGARAVLVLLDLPSVERRAMLGQLEFPPVQSELQRFQFALRYAQNALGRGRTFQALQEVLVSGQHVCRTEILFADSRGADQLTKSFIGFSHDGCCKGVLGGSLSLAAQVGSHAARHFGAVENCHRLPFLDCAAPFQAFCHV